MSENPADKFELLKKLGPTIRPLQGLDQRKIGSSSPLVFGAKHIALVDVGRTGTQDAEVLTVNCGLTLQGLDRKVILDPLFKPNNTVDIVGILDWGIGGANFQAEFDFNNGTCFSVAANYLRVTAEYRGDPVPGGNTDLNFQANAAVGYGCTTGQRAGSPKRTLKYGNPYVAPFSLPNGMSADFIIPNFATTFGVSCTATAVPAGLTAFPNLLIDVKTVDGIVGQQFTYGGYKIGGPVPTTRGDSNFGSQLESTYTLANGASIITVTNNSLDSLGGGLPVLLAVQFGLSL